MKKATNDIFNKITTDLIRPQSLKCAFAVIVCLALLGIPIQSFIQIGLLNTIRFEYVLGPSAVILNMFPLFLVISLVYFLFGRIWIGASVTYILLTALNIVNYFKTTFRGEMFKNSDLRLIGEVGNIVQSYEIKITYGMIAALIIVFASVLVTAKFFKPKKFKPKFKLGGIAVILICMVLSYKFIYSNNPNNANVATSKKYECTAETARENGFLYTFLSNIESDVYGMPEDYSKKNAEKILEEYEYLNNKEHSDEKINVIAIMGEAFFDVTRGNTAEFQTEKNPYVNYHRLKEIGYSGKMTVPGFGGSTESTEFEFLTGTSLYLLNESMPTAYKTYITQPAYSLVGFFKDEGYATTAIHPGNAWFYSRKYAYAHLGFDKFIACEDMDEDAPKIYGYIEDSYTTEQILSNYLQHYNTDPSTPYFSFTVTIQNHGAYPSFDYGRDEIYIRSDGISNENYWIINNYLNGVRDTDKLLGDVCDFAAQREEPIVVLFFGDHLPYLDDKIECFNAVGYDISHKSEIGTENRYTVEYLMYGNDSAKNVIEKSRGIVKSGEGPEISSGFLATELLDYMGAKMPAYFEFVNELKNEINVISPNYYKTENEKCYVLNDEQNELIKKYKILQYYNLRDYD